MLQIEADLSMMEITYAITLLAPNFAAFIQGLVNEEVFDTSEEDKQEDLRRVAQGQFSPLLSELCAHVDDVADIEGVIRTICTDIVEEKEKKSNDRSKDYGKRCKGSGRSACQGIIQYRYCGI
ncbi:hypothetical protein [Bacillus paralicheniformis]|uniref:hypothetical protein n=1 Tax=Bacillus paralicheniformis TaxID=1648923 RepID=UPI0030DA53B7